MDIPESEELFVNNQRMSGFPERGVDLLGGSFTWGRSRELLDGKSGKLPVNLWIAPKLHGERIQGELVYAPPPPPISGHKAFFRGGGWG